jgi:hypothetical protein
MSVARQRYSTNLHKDDLVKENDNVHFATQFCY